MDSTARLSAAKWQRVAISGCGQDSGGRLAAYRAVRPERGQLQVRAGPGAAEPRRTAADVCSLEDLAVPYAAAICISRAGEPTKTQVFVDERASRQGITLTDHLLELANGLQATVLPREVDARWNLVQMSWGLRLGTRLVSFEMTPDDNAVDLYAPARLRRGPITGVRAALSGYQDGRCAYCQSQFTDIGTSRVAVDHVLPFVLMSRGWQDGDLHQVWNLVLACYAYNSAKRDRPPAADWMPWLDQRGEDLIASHHPLRDTLISQLGPDRGSRHQRLARRHTAATDMIPSWTPPFGTAGRKLGQPLSRHFGGELAPYVLAGDQNLRERPRRLRHREPNGRRIPAVHRGEGTCPRRADVHPHPGGGPVEFDPGRGVSEDHPAPRGGASASASRATPGPRRTRYPRSRVPRCSAA